MNPDTFLTAQTFAVAGASTDSAKYGHKVFVALAESGRTVYPLNPKATEVAGHQSYASIGDLPVIPEALSIVTPPSVTREVVADAIDAGVKFLWMQPGAEDELAGKAARDAGLGVIDDGSCILVALKLG